MALTKRFVGYWDRAGIEIDLLAINEDERRLRLGTCKRSVAKLMHDLPNFEGHVGRFLQQKPEFRDWAIERMAIAPVLDAEARKTIESRGLLARDLADFFRPLG